MKKFKKIEKKDPYENVSTSKVSVRDFVDVKKLIIYSRFSFIGFIVFIFFLNSSLYQNLEPDFILNDFISIIISLIVSFVFSFIISMIFIVLLGGSVPFIYGIYKFIYNLIVNRIVGVDSYYDIVMILEYLLGKYKKRINDDFEYDEHEYEEYDEEYDDELNDCESNFEEDSNIIYIDFTAK